jgi:hypothetical protein
MARRIRELGSLAFATALVVAVCLLGYRGVMPRDLEDVAKAEVKEQTAAPALHLAASGILTPATYVAGIEALRWSDEQRHILDMRIESAQLVDVDAITGAVKGRGSAKADASDRIVGQRVLAEVDAPVVSKMKTPGQSTVRLVVVPRDQTVQVSVRDVVDPAAVRALVGTSTVVSAMGSSVAVTGLSAYSAAPGSRVTITGRGFGTTQRDSWVPCCGAKASVVSWSDTSVTFTVPAGAKKPGYVGVVVNGVTSNGLYFTPYSAPTLTSLSPREGAPGTVATLSGRGFGVVQGDGWVSFGGASGQVVSWSDTTVKVVVPKGVGTAYVGVVVHGVSSNGVLFAPYGCPAVDSLSATHVLSGGALTVNGRNFGAAPGRVVIAGQVVPHASWANDRVTLTVPDSVRSGYVGVIRASGLTSNGVYLLVAPRLDALSSWWASPGANLTLTGRGFGGAAGAYSVMIGGMTAGVTSWSDTTIRVTVPTTAKSGYVGVGTVASCSNGKYLVVETPAHVSSASPRTVSGGTVVTVTGSGFGAAKATSRVTVAGKVCSVVSWSDTKVVVKLPADATAGYLGVVKQGVASNGVWMYVR